MNFLIAGFVTFIACFIAFPIFFGLVRTLGLYATVEEGSCRVYVLFGRVLGILTEPGLHILPFRLGPAALLVNWLGKCHVVDLRMDQEYLRSQPVNSEEGAPMGVGIWYEMFLSDPVAYLFKNTNPRGSLAANVSNVTVRCLSNMRLAEMLEDRHRMSSIVRDEVTNKSREWGYSLGSVYIRKVHFRDTGMINQIEEKVVNRLRQVTYAIKQDGENQVNIIASTAERQAAVEFAKAAAMRPTIVGAVLQEISADPTVLESLFEILQTQKMLEGEPRITLLPQDAGMLAPLLASNSGSEPAPAGKRSAPPSIPPLPGSG